MVASARVAYLARRAADFGVTVGDVSVDLAAIKARKQKIVERFRGGSQEALQKADGVDLLLGHATFEGPHALKVTNDAWTRHLEAELIVINTGARPASPQLPGLRGPRVLDSTAILELDELPEHLVIIGGGYIGVEFAQMFRRFGSRVTLLQRSGRLLGQEDDDVAAAVAEILREDGIDLHFDAVPSAAAVTAAGISLTVRETGGRETSIEASHVLVATGRPPATEGLGLDLAGISTDENGFITVNERLETNVPGVYAIGDVKGGPAFTHIAYDDFRILWRRLVKGEDATTTGRQVPYTVYIDPQLGRIGLTERAAREAGYEIKVAKMPMEYVARAIEMDEKRGFLKAVVDAKTERILGAAVLGIEGGELMSMLQIAMLGDLSFHVLASATFAHPTLAESLNNLFEPLREKH
ncbi:MAG: mercuric reductase [Candidatus Limnocylindrales bacterium]